MALIFDQIENKPQLHAFVIGVGAYRHMEGGIDPRPQGLESVGLLKQLTSPPISAIAFKDTLIESESQWEQPLGSIEFLLSKANSQNIDGDFSEATIQNIKDSFADWKKRCDTHEENIALFYFCGHGVEKAGQFLLAEDFGANSNNPWEGSFSFDSTRLAFHKVKAKTQLFFVDACRKITSGMLQHNIPDLPLMIPGLSAECQFNLTVKASARNEVALGPVNGISYFTQALIKVFKEGALAESEKDNSWVIRSGQIAAQINQVLKRIKDSEDFRQRCITEISDSTRIFTMTSTPKVDVSISIIEDAFIFYEKIPNGHRQQRTQNNNPWVFNVDAGLYHIGVSIENEQNLVKELFESFDPPFTEYNIQIDLSWEQIH